MTARGYEEKTKLTPDEKLRVAFGYLCLGMSQHQLVALFNVNPGRINDAISDVREVLDWPKPEKDENND